MIIAGNAGHAFLVAAKQILQSGADVTVRGKRTKELLNETIVIERPLERCYFLDGRKDDIFHKVAETLWVLRGRNDMEFLKTYLPRCTEWSDDGLVWRAGYGPRLRGWKYLASEDNWWYEDQLENVFTLLRKDLTTRQAVVSIWDPGIDYEPSKDIPCTNWLHFIIRDDKLHLNIAQRSSDILWGFSGINTFEWSVLLQCMAYWTGIEVGKLTFFITSFHAYEEHWSKLQKIVDNYAERPYNYPAIPAPEFKTGFYAFDKALDVVFYNESLMCFNHPKIWGNIEKIEDPFLKTCAQLLYLKHRGNELCYVTEVLDGMDPSDLKLAAIYQLSSKIPNLVEHLLLTGDEALELKKLGI